MIPATCSGRTCIRPVEPGKSRCADCIAYQKEYGRKLKEDVYAAYGNACACCGETYVPYLTLDRVNNDGAEHRKKLRGGWYAMLGELRRLRYPDWIQILCGNCHLAKTREEPCKHP